MVTLKQASHVKYGHFVEPGQTLTVTANIISQDDKETTLKAQGAVNGRTIVGGRLVLARYNLADSDPGQAEVDETILKDLRQLLQVLYQPKAPNGPNSGVVVWRPMRRFFGN